MEPGRVDLESLGLRSGEATTMRLELTPDDPVVGGEPYPIGSSPVEARVEISRTTSGFALKLLADATITGPCARCLERAELQLEIADREVEQPEGEDAELRSPYVSDGILDTTAWLRDAITLALPEQVLCTPDCAGICAECGARLNDFEPGEHTHERPPDPRFAKLRELLSDDD